jgi:predicted ester cyclase
MPWVYLNKLFCQEGAIQKFLLPLVKFFSIKYKGASTMKELIHKILKAVTLFVIMVLPLTTGCQQKLDPSQELKPLADKFVEAWNDGNLGELDSVVDPNFTRHANQTPDVNGIVELKKIILGFRTAYPDLKIVIKDELYSENKSAGRWILTGTNTGSGELPPTDKSVTLWGVSVLHYANGKITEEWVGFDNQSFMEQLGFTMLPPVAEKK